MGEVVRLIKCPICRKTFSGRDVFKSHIMDCKKNQNVLFVKNEFMDMFSPGTCIWVHRPALEKDYPQFREQVYAFLNANNYIAGQILFSNCDIQFLTEETSPDNKRKRKQFIKMVFTLVIWFPYNDRDDYDYTNGEDLALSLSATFSGQFHTIQKSKRFVKLSTRTCYPEKRYFESDCGIIVIYDKDTRAQIYFARQASDVRMDTNAFSDFVEEIIPK